MKRDSSSVQSWVSSLRATGKLGYPPSLASMWSSLLPSQTYQECDNLVVPVGDSQEFKPSSDHRSSAILGLSRDLVFGRTKLATLMNVVSLLMHEISA